MTESVEELLRQRLAVAFESVAGTPVDPAIRRSQHADFQSDAALGLARVLHTSPRAVAERVLAAADLAGVCSDASVSGPGFLNLTVADGVLGALLAETAADPRLGVPVTDHPEVVVVDYSGPNAAKEMHVGHLRSTIIGDAVVRLLEFLGHTVIRQNHIGEWGTPFGMLIEHLLDVGEAAGATELSTGDLTRFYTAARRTFDADPDFAARARARVVALQSGDPATRRLWRILVEDSKRYFATVYDTLGVRLTDADYDAESSYQDQLTSIVDELAAAGLLRTSDGAGCVFPAGFTGRDGEPLPLIVRKSDGGFGYAATDLATVRHRVADLKATRLLYVLGSPQHQYLEMIFQTAREAGWLADPVVAEHVGHGSVLSPEDGRMLRTRAGTSLRLRDLLDEAVTRARATLDEKNPALPPETRAGVARAVGVGAVKYADLATDRTKDYVFDLDRMLSFDGSTAPYLQFAHARIRSIFRRAEATQGPASVPPPGRTPATVPLSDPAEHVLALALLGFAPLCTELAKSLELHRLAQYLYSLAATVTTFLERCPVLRADPRTRAARLTLCDLTARTLHTGLSLLGIDCPDRM